jgi:hypothetical protein
VNLREQRAIRFVNNVMGLTRDFLPSGSEFQRRIYDALYKIAYDANYEIIEVPVEYDHLTKIQLQHRMLETHPIYVAVEGVLK